MKQLIVFFQKPWMAVFLSVFVYYLCITPSENLPEVGDKLAHILAFAALSFCWFWYAKVNLKVVVGLILFGVLIELSQALLPLDFYRSGDWKDVAADTLGILPGYLAFLVSQLILKKYN